MNFDWMTNIEQFLTISKIAFSSSIFDKKKTSTIIILEPLDTFNIEQWTSSYSNANRSSTNISVDLLIISFLVSRENRKQKSLDSLSFSILERFDCENIKTMRDILSTNDQLEKQLTDVKDILSNLVNRRSTSTLYELVRFLPITNMFVNVFGKFDTKKKKRCLDIFQFVCSRKESTWKIRRTNSQISDELRNRVCFLLDVVDLLERDSLLI